MPILKNPRHERFAQLRASGKTGSDAYREAVSNKTRNADVNASQLANMPGVRQRIEELKAEAADKCSLSREQALDWLASVVQTPAGQVTKDSPLCQSYKDTGGIKEIRMPDKIAAVTQLAKMCNWHVAEKIHLEATDTLTAFVQAIRQGGPSRAAGMLHNGGRQ